ncbi:MAG: shikimate kinase [Chloroflexi bacterium]|nr:shikimate kinase [Chloroflexota bacterium]
MDERDFRLKTNIALIGYMGTGKTAVGRRLAEKLDMRFFEVDWLIEQLAGKKIPEVFREDGEIAFRELEIEAVRQIAMEKNAVIACGGGVVLNKINIDRLRERGVIVCLTASAQTILKRTALQQGQRPLLDVKDPLQTIKDMLQFRKPYYERSADIMINTSKLDIEGVVEEIIAGLKENESFDFKK